jgi:hypothetical protein
VLYLHSLEELYQNRYSGHGRQALPHPAWPPRRHQIGRAGRRGPAAVARRAVRRRVYRAEGRTTRRIFKGFGL